MRGSLILWLARNWQQMVLVTALLVGVSTAHASTTPTPTPTRPSLAVCVPIPCGGDCAVPAPCTPGTACPQYAVKATCEVVSNTCACVTNPLTPVPTPTFGGCGLSCDDRPCLGQCADGSIVQGFCTSLTVDRGCACAFGCATPTPTPFAVCTPPPCKPGEVFSCPGSCPGGCGTLCATPTTSPTIPPTPMGPCASVPCGGTCSVCPPCTPGTVCPNYCELGTCEMVSGSCACVPGISTPTPTSTPAISACIGDCNRDGAVTVDELVTGINIALGTTPVSACPALQCPSSGPPGIFIDCFIIAVNNLLDGCTIWYEDCGPPHLGSDTCPSTVMFCTTEQVGAACGLVGSSCCQPGSMCAFGECNTPLVCTNAPPSRCPN